MENLSYRSESFYVIWPFEWQMSIGVERWWGQYGFFSQVSLLPFPVMRVVSFKSLTYIQLFYCICRFKKSNAVIIIICVKSSSSLCMPGCEMLSAPLKASCCKNWLITCKKCFPDIWIIPSYHVFYASFNEQQIIFV